MAEYIVTSNELTSVAAAIRDKTGESGSLAWPSGFISSIQSITGGGSVSITDTMTLLASNWVAGTDDYIQTPTLSVTIDSDSKVDLQSTAAIIAQMVEDDTLALYAVNTNGTVIVHAVGDPPTENLTIQYTVTDQIEIAERTGF